MSVVTCELLGRTATLNGAIRRYSIRGAADEAAAVAAVMAESPLLVGALPRTGVQADETRVAQGVWEATITYGMGDMGQPGAGEIPRPGDSPSFAFEFGMESTRILLPPKGGEIRGFGRAGHPEPPPRYMIGDIGDPEQPPSGADVTTPHFEFSKTLRLEKETVDDEYIATCGELMGTLNDDTFVGFPAESVLAIGVSGSLVSLFEHWEVTFRFAMRRHQTGLQIGDVTYDKKGWQFMWPVTEKKAADGGYYEEVVAVYVSDLYETEDFSRLGIGT